MSDNLAWLKDIRALVFDMDGVLWRGKEALPGLNEIFDWMTAEQIPYLLATNNSMSTAQMYVERLAGHGVTVPKETIITSGIAVRDYLRLTYPPDVTVGAVGMQALYRGALRRGRFHAGRPPPAGAGRRHGSEFRLRRHQARLPRHPRRGGLHRDESGHDAAHRRGAWCPAAAR